MFWSRMSNLKYLEKYNKKVVFIKTFFWSQEMTKLM